MRERLRARLGRRWALWLGLAAALCGVGAFAWKRLDERPPPVPDAPPSDPSKLPAPAPRARPGAQLRVRTEPAGASVSVDGRDAGVAPMVVNVEANRAHAVEARAEGVVVGHAEVVLEPDEIREVVFTAPRPERARLRVLSAPGGATVAVDGEVIGRTPIEAPVRPGRHRVRVSRSGFESRDGVVEVADGEAETTVSFGLTPAP